MKKIVRLICLVLSCVLVLFTVACNGAGNTDSGNTGGSGVDSGNTDVVTHSHTGVHYCEGCGESFASMWEDFLGNYDDNRVIIEASTYGAVLASSSDFDVVLVFTSEVVTTTQSLTLGYDNNDSKWTYMYTMGEGSNALSMYGQFSSINENSNIPYSECDFDNPSQVKGVIKDILSTLIYATNYRLNEKDAGFTMANLGLDF